MRSTFRGHFLIHVKRYSFFFLLKYEIQDLKESVEAASLVESQLDKKDELIKHLQTQGTVKYYKAFLFE